MRDAVSLFTVDTYNEGLNFLYKFMIDYWVTPQFMMIAYPVHI